MSLIALALVIVGLLLMLAARRRKSSASFDDGTFLVTILLWVAGSGCVIGGGLWLIVLAFIALVS